MSKNVVTNWLYLQLKFKNICSIITIKNDGSFLRGIWRIKMKCTYDELMDQIMDVFVRNDCTLYEALYVVRLRLQDHIMKRVHFNPLSNLCQAVDQVGDQPL